MVITEDACEFKDRPGRISDLGQVCLMDSAARVLGIHIYQGLLKIIPIHDKKNNKAIATAEDRQRANKRPKNAQLGDFGKPFDLRFYDELDVHSLVFLELCQNDSAQPNKEPKKLQLAVLFKDARNLMRVRVYPILLEEQYFGPKSSQEEIVHDSARTLVPLSEALGYLSFSVFFSRQNAFNMV